MGQVADSSTADNDSTAVQYSKLRGAEDRAQHARGRRAVLTSTAPAVRTRGRRI